MRDTRSIILYPPLRPRLPAICRRAATPERVRRVAREACRCRLTDEERAEPDDYECITALLELMQSKARRSLKEVGLSL